MTSRTKTILSAAVTLFGAVQSFATSPVPPYIPTEDFQYRCQITVQGDYYRQGEHSKRWTSTAVMELDRKGMTEGPFRNDFSKLNWQHLFAEQTVDYLPFMPEGKPIADSPYVKDSSVYLHFDYPRNGVTKVNLTVSMSNQQGDVSSSSSSTAQANFADRKLAGEVDVSQWDDKAHVSRGKKVSAVCERVR